MTPEPRGPADMSILKFAREERPLIIFDSLIGFHSGSEQDASETRRHFQYYRRLAAVGASPVVLHHTGKGDNSKQYRGSSDIKGAVDCAYLLEALGDTAAGLKTLRLTPFKSRLSLVQTVRLEYAAGRFLVSREQASPQRETVERIVEENPGLSESGLVKRAMEQGIAKHKAEALFADAVRDDWLERNVGKRGKKTYRRLGVKLGQT